MSARACVAVTGPEMPGSSVRTTAPPGSAGETAAGLCGFAGRDHVGFVEHDDGEGLEMLRHGAGAWACFAVGALLVGALAAEGLVSLGQCDQGGDLALGQGAAVFAAHRLHHVGDRLRQPNTFRLAHHHFEIDRAIGAGVELEPGGGCG